LWVLTHWFLVLAVSITVSAGLMGPIFYQRVLVEAGKLKVLGYNFDSIWTFRLVFYLQFFPLYVVLTLAIYWLYDRANWFGNKWWIISLTFLLSERVATTFWIWHFKKELPDVWMVAGMLALLIFMAISMSQRN